MAGSVIDRMSTGSYCANWFKVGECRLKFVGCFGIRPFEDKEFCKQNVLNRNCTKCDYDMVSLHKLSVASIMYGLTIIMVPQTHYIQSTGAVGKSRWPSK